MILIPSLLLFNISSNLLSSLFCNAQNEDISQKNTIQNRIAMTSFRCTNE